MMTVIEILGVWLLCMMVYRANPLNDPSNPKSKQHYYHPENVRARRFKLRELQRDPDQVIINWNKVVPYLMPVVMTGICIFIDIMVS